MNGPVEPARAPTMGDVAAAAGVSRALVSIVFRRAPGASDETRARVFQVADELGYRANRSASLLKLHRTKHLGVTMHVRSAFHGELVDELQAAADRAGYQLVLSPVTSRHDERQAMDALLEYRCEALILLGSELPEPELVGLSRSTPIVIIGRAISGARIRAVQSSDERGQRLLVDHLVTLGHERIAHVDGGRGAISASRRRGYRAAMRAHGLRLDDAVVLGGAEEADGRRAAAAVLALTPRPTAVTAFNDLCALGLLDALAEAGVAVPADLSVAGYDDAPFARLSGIGLTSVSQDAVAQADRAVAAAIGLLESQAEASGVALEPRLVVRRTTGPAPGGASSLRP